MNWIELNEWMNEWMKWIKWLNQIVVLLSLLSICFCSRFYLGAGASCKINHVSGPTLLISESNACWSNTITQMNEWNDWMNWIDAINKKDYRTDIVEQCPKLFKELGEIGGGGEIKLNENSKPFALTVPRKVPLPLLSKTKQKIDRMLKIDVIRIVNEPTDWCALMVVLPKQNGQMRICLDLTKLIANIKREVHPLPSVEFTLGKLENSKVFSKLDANSAFWQRKLSEESKLLTTFIIPLGET